MSAEPRQDAPFVHHFGRVRQDELPVPFFDFTSLEATDADGQRHVFWVPTAALAPTSVVEMPPNASRDYLTGFRAGAGWAANSDSGVAERLYAAAHGDIELEAVDADDIKCGRCGDVLTTETIVGHLLSEGRVLADCAEGLSA